MLGRLLPNFFADKFGPYNMLLPCLYISAALAFAWFGILNFAGIIVFGLLYGFWSGSCEFKFGPSFFSVYELKPCLTQTFL